MIRTLKAVWKDITDFAGLVVLAVVLGGVYVYEKLTRKSR